MASKGSRNKGSGQKTPPRVDRPETSSPSASSSAPKASSPPAGVSVSSSSAGSGGSRGAGGAGGGGGYGGSSSGSTAGLPDGGSSPAFRDPVLWVLLIALLGGLFASVHLTHLHLDLVYGKGVATSLCDFGTGFNCSEVNASTYAELFGFLPLSLMAIPAYSVMLMLTLLGRSLKDRRALGLVTLLGLISTVFSVYLAYVSKVIIGSFCLFCMSMYLVNVLALVLPMVAARESLGNMLRSGFEALMQRRLVLLAAFNALIVGSLAWGGYVGVKNQMQADAISQAVNQPNSAPSGSQTPAKPGATTPADPNAQKVAHRGPDERADVPVDASVAFLGAKDARVTIITYEDFQCGFCKRLAGNFDELVAKYPKDVRVGFRNFPMNTECSGAKIARSMHPDACRAAIAGECAHLQGQFWPYHDLMFKNQQNLKSKDLEEYAQQVGLDMNEFNSCLKDPGTVDKIRADSLTGGNLGVSGTPTFFINGRQFAGAQPVEVMSAVVDAELKGQNMTMAQLREVAEQTRPQDITGQVSAPEMVKLKGPYGEFEIDSFEASMQGRKAISKAGAVAASDLTWFDADAACKASGKRLCTDAEWLTACQGSVPEDRNHDGSFTDDYVNGLQYPYGDHYKPGLCNDAVELPKGADPKNPPPPPPLITGNHPQCKSKNGVYDLAGNVREWVGTVASRSAFMGGGFYSRDDAACGSRNESAGPTHKQIATGFRCCRGGSPPEAVTHPGREVGQTLSRFTAPTLEGKTFNSDSLKGKVTLLTFWASWCGPCRKELPAYSAVYAELEKKGFQIVGINVDSDSSKAREFLDRYPLNFPILMDPDSSLFRSFDIKGNGTLPTAFLVDKNGQIIQRKIGYDDGDETRLKNTVEKMLGG